MCVIKSIHHQQQETTIISCFTGIKKCQLKYNTILYYHIDHKTQWNFRDVRM